MVVMSGTIEDGGKVIPCQWIDRDGCVAKNTKHFQGVDLQPYSLDHVECCDDCGDDQTLNVVGFTRVHS